MWGLMLKEYIDFLPIDKHETERFMFVSKDTKADDLAPLFSQKIDGKRLVMIFVSDTGKTNEKVIGIITSYDLLQRK